MWSAAITLVVVLPQCPLQISFTTLHKPSSEVNHRPRLLPQSKVILPRCLIKTYISLCSMDWPRNTRGHSSRIPNTRSQKEGLSVSTSQIIHPRGHLYFQMHCTFVGSMAMLISGIQPLSRRVQSCQPTLVLPCRL